MAWVDRVVEYPNRVKLNPVSGEDNVYNIEANEGTVYVEGTLLNAENLSNETKTIANAETNEVLNDIGIGATAYINGNDGGSVTLATTPQNILYGGTNDIESTNTSIFSFESLNSEIKILKSGYYLVIGKAYFTTNFIKNDILHVQLKNNSNTIAEALRRAPYPATGDGVNPYETLETSVVEHLNANDVISLQVYNQTGARGQVQRNGNCKLIAIKLGD